MVIEVSRQKREYLYGYFYISLKAGESVMEIPIDILIHDMTVKANTKLLSEL